MPIDSEKSAAELYQEGINYDQREDQFPDAAVKARELFSQATARGHLEAQAAYAGYVYAGRGGAQDKLRAFVLLWDAFNKGNREALDDLANLLEEFSREAPHDSHKAAAAKAATDVERLKTALQPVTIYMQELTRAVVQGQLPRT